MQDKLGSTFGFTGEDLFYNQQGRLSSGQANQLARTNRKQKVILTFAALACGGVALLLLYPFIQSWSLEAANLGQGIAALVLAALSLLFFSGLFDKPAAGVKMVEGPVQFISSDVSTQHGDQVETTTVFYLVVAERRFPVETGQYQAFTQGHIYRFYFGAAPTLAILSIEYVGPPPAER